MPGPADHRRHAIAPLKWRVEEISAPWPLLTSAKLQDCPTAAIVATEDDDGIVVDARRLDGIHDLADAVVHFGDQVRKHAAALRGLTRKIRIGDHRWMHF